MKRKLLLLTAALMCAVGSWAYQTPMDGGIYYLYNTACSEGTPGFLSSGNGYGFQAVIDNYGFPVKLISTGTENTYKFQCIHHEGYLKGNDWVYTDGTEDHSEVLVITIQDQGDGKYKLLNTNNGKEVEDWYGNVVGDGTGSRRNYLWQFLSKDERNAIVAGYTRDIKIAAATSMGMPADIDTEEEFDSYLSKYYIGLDQSTKITNGTFTTSHVTTDWTTTANKNRNFNIGWGNVDPKDTPEIYEGAGYLTHKTISVDKVGLYKISVNATYRCGDAANNNRVGDLGYDGSVAYLQANSSIAKIPDWYSGKINGNGPDSPSEANSTYFSAGKYLTEVYVYVGDTKTIDISLHSPAMTWRGWLMFNNFKLTYYKLPIENANFEEGTDPWTYSGMVRQNNTSLTEKNGTWYVEAWQPDGSKSVSQTISNLPAGIYRLSALAYVRGVASAKIYAGTVERSITVDASAKTYSLEFACNGNENVTIGFEGVGTGAGSSWLCVDNFQLELLSSDFPELTVVEGKMNADIAAAQTTAVNTYNSEKNSANYNAASLAIAKARYSKDVYAEAYAAITKAESIVAETNVFSAADKNTYQNAIDVAKTTYNNGSMTDETALDLEKTLNGGTQYNPSTPMRNFYGSIWTATNDVNVYTNSWSTEGNSDGSQFTTPFIEDYVADGQTLANTTISASITSLAEGNYQVTAKVRLRLNDNGTAPVNGVSLQINSGEVVTISGTPTYNNNKFYVADVTAIGEVAADGILNIKFTVDGTNASWLGIKAVNYEQIAGSSDYEALNSAISIAEAKSLGFEVDEYAPYNNVEALEALKKAKEIDQNATNLKADIDEKTIALADAIWTVNVSEMNAIYNPTFSLSTDNMTAIGWGSNDGTVIGNESGIYHSRALVGNDNLTAMNGTKSALYLRYDGTNSNVTTIYNYGSVAGYTMPLKAGTIYRFKADAAVWSTDNNQRHKDLKVAILNSSSIEVAGQTLTTPNSSMGAGSNDKIAFDFLFCPASDGNYTLTVDNMAESSTGIVISNFELKKAASQVFTFKEDGTTSAYAAGTYPTVALDRTFSTTYLSTVVLPFGLNATATSAAFDKVYELTSVAGNTMHFDVATSIVAGKPYLVKAINETLEVSDVALNPATVVTNTEVEDANNTTVTFVGSFDPVNAVPEGSYVVSNDLLYYVNSSISMKGYRGYFTVEGVSGVKNFVLGFGEGEDAIEEINANAALENATIYNLAGQRVSKAQKGIYIVNGKKVAIK